VKEKQKAGWQEREALRRVTKRISAWRNGNDHTPKRTASPLPAQAFREMSPLPHFSPRLLKNITLTS